MSFKKDYMITSLKAQNKSLEEEIKGLHLYINHLLGELGRQAKFTNAQQPIVVCSKMETTIKETDNKNVEQ